MVQEEDSGSEVEYIKVVGIGDNQRRCNYKTVMVHMQIEHSKKNVEFQIDTGASVNVLPRSLVPDINLEPTTTILKTWDSTEVIPDGKTRIIIRNPKTRKKYSVEFIIINKDLCPILSKQTSEKMKLITINYDKIQSVKKSLSTKMDVMEEYADVFAEEIGSLPGKVHLHVDETVQPVAVASCRVPVSVKKKVTEKLEELVQHNFIVKVDEPSEWVSRMVSSIKKNNSLRICIDPLALNRALKTEMHPLPILDDILQELGKARVFTKVDLRNGYWHCILDDESGYMTTFQTPEGRYRWLRLPFGLSVSSEIFQKRLHQALEGLKNVICVADDVLVYGIGEDDEDAIKNHDENLKELLGRCPQQGIRLNGEKTVFRQTEVTFLGYKIGKEGLKADPAKVEAVMKMKPPTNVTEIQRLTGMVNYLSRFLPRLSEVFKPIRKLTVKDTVWLWGQEQDQAFREIKNLVTSAPVLSYYDQTKPLEIQCDASQSGIGSVLLQEGRPICYASRAIIMLRLKRRC